MRLEERAYAERNHCLVCWDEFRLPWLNLHRRGCCSRAVCWSCLAGHIDGVMSDETRVSIRCPCCDEVDLTDLEIRRAIHVSSWYGAWRRQQRAKVRRYELWSVAAGCKQLAPYLEILQCPGLDCDNFFLVGSRSRRAKLRNEPQWYWNPLSRKWLYHPPLNRDGGDCRRVYCRTCRKAFCSLCRRSWQQPRKGYRGAPDGTAPVESHDNRACVSFAGRSIDQKEDFNAVGDAAGARSCPRCSLRIERTYGCNHIECPNCAQHWCFICEAAWDPSHYACRDLQGDTFKAPNPQANCALM
mmetsp:Transcript_17979/g.56380  ORF Transcript_17979/g.56380 Transcript_17979/m.56380 type:complete len:299 (-) Transcript_17979:103-999(-)